MDFQKLKQFAAQLPIERKESSLNALELARQLNILYKDENGAKMDFRG